MRPDGSGDAPSIQAAIDSAATSDSIVVAAGSYDENLDMSGKLLHLIGAGAPRTIVDGGGRTSVLIMKDGTVTGFTLRNGHAFSGGGILVLDHGSAIIRSNIIEENRAGFSVEDGDGGGIRIRQFVYYVLVESNLIRGNGSTGTGGGISAPGRSIIRGNIIIRNSSHLSGGGIYGGDLVVDNFILDNYCDYQGAGFFSAGEVRNNTVIGNRLGLPTGAANVARDNAVAKNIIVGNNSVFPGGRATALHCVQCVLECNDIWGNGDDAVAGFGNTETNGFSADPEFCAVDPLVSMSFTLQSDSPCAPGNRVPCGLIGAAPVGCQTVATRQGTWTSVKLLYRGFK